MPLRRGKRRRTSRDHCLSRNQRESQATMDGPAEKRKARLACHRNAPILVQSSAANNGAKPAPAQEREALWHALAVQHQQRALMLAALEAINAKLAALLDIAMRKGGLP